MPRPRMKVYAAGRNEFGQLRFDPEQQTVSDLDLPEDIFSFTPILEGETIDQVKASLACTVVHVDGKLVSAGSAMAFKKYTNDQQVLKSGMIWSEDATGQVLATRALIQVNACDPCLELAWYPTTETWVERKPLRIWTCGQRIKQIASYETGWILLYEDGTVKTLGDSRYHDCLGREPTPECPANQPCELPDFVDLGERFKYVAGGGYTVAAVTQSGALYAWGMRSPARPPDLSQLGLNGVPNYFEVAGGEDIDEVAIGQDHIMVLTIDGDIYAQGSNKNGQLGLGKGHPDRVKSWTRVNLGRGCEYKPVSIIAGPHTSLIVAQHKDI